MQKRGSKNKGAKRGRLVGVKNVTWLNGTHTRTRTHDSLRERRVRARRPAAGLTVRISEATAHAGCPYRRHRRLCSEYG